METRDTSLTLTDFFSDSPYVVELEKDLSLCQQFLDVVILKRQPGVFSGSLPDGLENLAEHSLSKILNWRV